MTGAFPLTLRGCYLFPRCESPGDTMLLRPLIALLGLLALLGCAGPNFDTPAAGAGGNAGIDGGAGDPSAPAYFNETVGDRVFFALDESSLSDAAKASLDDQAAWLEENPEFRVVIEGHADERGTRDYNLALGARRANAARDYLIAQGIAGGRLRTVSYGKERPVAVCSEESCYAQNRRAVSVLSVPETG